MLNHVNINQWVNFRLAINPVARFVVLLRRPSDWLLSFFRYRSLELREGGGNAGWAEAIAAAEP